MYCLDVENGREIIRTYLSDSFYEVPCLGLAVFGASEEMIGSFGDIPLLGFVPMPLEFSVLHGAAFGRFNEYEGDRLDVFRGKLGSGGPA